MEKINENIYAFRRNVAFTLQYFQKQACVHANRRSKHSITERGIQRFFEFIELLQELAVVRIVVDVDFVFCKHKALAGYKMTLFEKSFHFLASRKKNIHFVDIFVHTI